MLNITLDYTLHTLCRSQHNICNEEGKLLNLPMCRSLHEAEDIICGSFFICGAPADAENFTSLTSEQMKRYEERFHFPEVFLPVSNKGVFVLSCQ